MLTWQSLSTVPGQTELLSGHIVLFTTVQKYHPIYQSLKQKHKHQIYFSKQLPDILFFREIVPSILFPFYFSLINDKKEKLEGKDEITSFFNDYKIRFQNVEQDVVKKQDMMKARPLQQNVCKKLSISLLQRKSTHCAQ